MNCSSHQEKTEGWYHVAILGAGVSGLLCAIALATIDSNLDIVVVDHSRLKYPGSPLDDEPSQHSKLLPSDHIWLNAHSLEILNALNLLEDITQLAKPIHSICVMAPDGTSREVKRFAKASSTKFASGIIIEQWKLERYLANHLEALNVEVWRFHAVTEIDINSQDNRVSATEFPVSLKCREYKATSLAFQWADEVRTILCKFVIGADGHHSIVKRTLGISLLYSLDPTYEYMLADYTMIAECEEDGTAYPVNEDDWMSQIRIIHRNAGTGIVWPYSEPYKFRLMMRRKRASNGKRAGSDVDTDDPDYVTRDNLCAELSSHSMSPGFTKRDSHTATSLAKSSYKRLNPANDDQLKHIANVIFGPGWLVKDVVWKRAFSMNYEFADAMVKIGQSTNSAADTTYGGILIGNAARGAPPLWSVGLNLGVEDVHQLAWRLVAVIRNKAPSSILSKDFNNLRLTRTQSVFEVCAHDLDNLVNADKCLTGEKWKSRMLSNSVQKLLNIQSGTDLLKEMNCIHTLGYDDPDVPGLSAIRVVNLNRHVEGTSKTVELNDCLRLKPMRNHIFLMIVRLLPHGTKIKTIFGCERSELAERYNPKEVESLISLTHAMSSRLREITFVWIFTPTSRTKGNEFNAVSDPNKYMQKVPVDLLTRVPKYHLTYYDHDGEAYQGLNIKFEDSTTPLLSKQTCREEIPPNAGAAYCLLNPEGRRIAQSLIGDKVGLQKVDSYLRTYSIVTADSRVQ